MSAMQSGALQRWTAASYARNGQFVHGLAGAVFDMLAPGPGMRILDIGCGDGALTERIAARGADVVGIDLSGELLQAAQARGLDACLMDAHALPFDKEFDAVFSNAALHWMPRPAEVIASVARALKPGGRFVGEFSGHGNIAAIATAMRAVGQRYGIDPARAQPLFFPTPEHYRSILEKGGFEVETIELVPRPTKLDAGMKGWLVTFGRVFLDQIPAEDRDAVLRELLDLLRPSLCDEQGVWTGDHIRLRFATRLPA
jgi:SAM-dependent methyltransferase